MFSHRDTSSQVGGLSGVAHLWSRLRPSSKDPGGLLALRFLPFYFAVAVLLFFLLWSLASYLLPSETPRLWQQMLAEAILLLAAIVPAFGIARLEERSFGAYGLPLRTAVRRSFAVGALMGMAALSSLLVMLRLLRCLSFGGVHLHGLRIEKFALFWAMFFLLVGVFEEFAFRGYVLFALSKAAGFWPAALISSALFGYVHHSNRGETWVGALGAAALGLFFCFTVRRSGNLWFAVGLHASWNWGQTFLYGVPDSGILEPGHLLQASLYGPSWLSGGSVGPEGSVLLFGVIALLWLLFDRLYPRKVALASQLPETSRSNTHPSEHPSPDD